MAEVVTSGRRAAGCRACEALEWLHVALQRVGPGLMGWTRVADAKETYIAVRAVYGHSCGDAEKVARMEARARQ